MASDAEAQLDLLDELLQDAGEDRQQPDKGEAPTMQDAQEAPDVKGDDEEMSAEDVLQQLDNVTLSLDAGREAAEAGMVEAQLEPLQQEVGAERIQCEALSPLIDEHSATIESTEELDEDEMVDAREVEAAVVVESESQRDDTADGEGEVPSMQSAKATVVEVEDGVVVIADEEVEREAEVETPNNDDTSTAQAEAGADEEETGAHDAEVEETSQPLLEEVESDASNENADDDLSPGDTSTVPVEEPALTAPSPVEAAQPSSRHLSSDGSWEAVAPPPPVVDADATVESTMPPPAPTPTVSTTQALFSGSLNPAKAQLDTAGSGDADDQEDSDSDSDDDDVEGSSPPPPPLSLDAVLGDDDEELEVDAAVVEEILAATKKKDLLTSVPSIASIASVEKPLTTTPSNALLDALEAVNSVPKSVDTIDDFSKTDEITLGFGDNAVEVRSAQVLAPPPAVMHPESSAGVFGIGYQSLRKRPDHAVTEDAAAYSIAKGPTFQELEREVTLISDGSLSSQHRQPVETEDDEFGSIPEEVSAASPTRVDAILQKTRASFAAKSAEEVEAALVAELKRATVHEKQHVRATETPTTRDAGNKPEGDNALTLKELHSIYKRGLGDQEVRMLEDEDENEATTTRSSAYNTTDGSASTATPAVVGGMLSKPTLTAHAITEEEDEDDDDEHNREGHDTLNDEDADAVSMHSERMTFDDRRSNTPPRAEGHAAANDWKEIQLAPASSIQKPAHQTTVMADANASTSSSKISYAEALQYFLGSDDVLVHRDRIVAEEKPPAASCFSCFSRPRLAFGGAIEQRDRLFCVAATKFDARNVVHVRMLQTIYRRFMNTNRDVPLMGPHWETIGFQGTDPSTDLRGCGVLSLLQILHVVESHAEFARRFHAVSQHPTRHFPLACALINVTLQCLVALRSGALYKESNKRGSVFDAANALHVAIATQLMKEIQSSTDEIPFVMKRVLDSGRLNPDRVMEAHALSSPQNRQPSSRKSGAENVAAGGGGGRGSLSHAAAEFTEIGLHSVGDEA